MQNKIFLFSIVFMNSILLNSIAQQNLRRVMVTIETDLGQIKIAMELEKAPLHSGNFIKLAGEGFFDSTTFHQVVPGFVI
jgi:hypothetical protein